MKTPFGRRFCLFALTIIMAALLGACGNATSASSNGQVTVHLGYFPNITHAVAVVGVARGIFQNDLGSKTKLVPTTFNAGPALVEAMFAGDIDIGYVGPNPAINGYVKSHGAALRIIAGAASGGAEFVVRPGANIRTPQDLANKKIATPQKGGTQDIALRYFLKQHGLQTTDEGGSVQVVPTDNSNILTLFKSGRIDGAWVPEPWGTRLVVEGKGQIFVDEKTLWPGGKFITTDVIVRKAFLDQYPDVVDKFLQGHVDAVQYIEKNPTSASALVNSEIKRITGKGIAKNEIATAFKNVTITYDPLASTLLESANRAYTLGFLGTTRPNLDGIFDLGPLNKVLGAKNLPTVAGS